MDVWSAIVYEGLQRIMARRMGQVECREGDHGELGDGRCTHCGAQV